MVSFHGASVGPASTSKLGRTNHGLTGFGGAAAFVGRATGGVSSAERSDGVSGGGGSLGRGGASFCATVPSVVGAVRPSPRSGVDSARAVNATSAPLAPNRYSAVFTNLIDISI